MKETFRPFASELKTQPPTRVRYKVFAFVAVLGMITYLDRVCISTLSPHIMEDLGISKVQMGYVFSIFSLSYALFEIPTAWWADRVGTRSVLTRIVIWWSTFTIATGVALNYSMLLITRFLFGLGEAGAWPSVARTFSRWIPLLARGRVQGLFFAIAHLGGGLTPLVVAGLLSVMHWRMIFFCFGVIGFVWAAAWYGWFRNEPAEHREVNAAELELIVKGRGEPYPHVTGWAYWKKLLSSRSVLALCLMYIPNSVGFYFCITWLPTYLREKHGFDAAQLVFFAGLPLILSVTGDLSGGIVTDRITARFGLRAGRCAVGASSYLVAGVALLMTPFCANAIVAAVLIAAAVAASMFMLAAAWGTCIDIGREHAGVVSAAMNTAGGLGALVSPVAVAYVLKWYGNWNIAIFAMAALFLMGALCWIVIDPRDHVFKGAEGDGAAQPAVS
ncbi:MAG: putative sulfoacetate transporter SauU [Verrucomicrobiota bacterium]|jgi:MFS family permease